MSAEVSIYEVMGGEQTVRRLVETFYPKVQQHPLLSPLFPADIEPVMEKQFLFLSQLLGGPSLYSDLYGHPMMRARHMAFPIDQERADAWLACMNEALLEVGLESPLVDYLMERFTGMAYHFRNR